MNYDELKAYQREHREHFHPNLALRTHRALSWLNRAEQEIEDEDAQFVFLWIAFNSSYAVEIENQPKETERLQFTAFFDKICGLDTDKQIYNALWSLFSSQIRALLDNQYVYQPFWDYHNGRIPENEWLERFKTDKHTAGVALANQDTVKVLSIIFSRLYTLRNQLIHGGSTWNSGANRKQIHEGCAMLGTIVPLIIDIMMKNPNTLWGDAYYPVVSD
jgi:hypothetical protein